MGEGQAMARAGHHGLPRVRIPALQAVLGCNWDHRIRATPDRGNRHSAFGQGAVIDLKAFRAALIRHRMNAPGLIMGDQVNADGTQFKWFDMRSFPSEPPLVVARSGH